MMADAEVMGKAVAGGKAAGFVNQAFMAMSMNQAFCIWEGAGGKTQDDMQKFIDSNEFSPAKTEGGVTNTVFAVKGELSGPSPWPSAFAADYKQTPTENKGERTV